MHVADIFAFFESLLSTYSSAYVGSFKYFAAAEQFDAPSRFTKPFDSHVPFSTSAYPHELFLKYGEANMFAVPISFGFVFFLSFLFVLDSSSSLLPDVCVCVCTRG